MDRFDSPRQQPAWISASTEEMAVRERAFFRSVYGWMFGGLLLTTLAAWAVTQSVAMQQLVLGTGAWIVLFLAELGLVFYLSSRITKITPQTAGILFLTFSLLNGLSLSSVFLIYAKTSILNAFVGAAGMFGAMALYGTFTKRDLGSWGSFFMMGLMGVVILSIVNIFMASSAINFTIGVVGIFVFLGLTAYDHWKLKRWAHAGGGMQQNLAIIGALELYLDFVNLFLMLLRVFGRRR